MSQPATIDYSYRPSLLGAVWQFSLTDGGLAWRAGRRSGVWSYADIAHIQLSYRPVSMQRRRFRCDIRARDGRALPVVSATWQSMIAVVPQDGPYRAFVVELHRRVAVAGQTTFGAGLRRPAYVAGTVLVVLVGLALAGLLWRALAAAHWSGALFILACAAMFGWQIGSFIRRNRPRGYAPHDIPAELLPPPT